MSPLPRRHLSRKQCHAHSSTEEITTIEAAERLGVIPRRVRQYIEGGRLKARKMGRDHLVDVESVATFKPRPAGNPEFGSGFRRPPGGDS